MFAYPEIILYELSSQRWVILLFHDYMILNAKWGFVLFSVLDKASGEERESGI